MAYGFLGILSTPGVRAARAANGSRELWEAFGGDRASDGLTEAEAACVQALDETARGFAGFRGNRQYISLGNVASDDRAALFLMDYPNRRRLKILAHASIRDLAADPALAARLATPGAKGRPERAFILKLEAFDWNCPQHITPRFTADEVAGGIDVLPKRLAEAEAELKRLRDRLERPGTVETSP